MKDELYIYSLAGERLKRVASDFIGTITVNGVRDQSWFFASMVGFTTPGTIARFDFKEQDDQKQWSTHRITRVKGLNPDDFTAEQVCLDF